MCMPLIVAHRGASAVAPENTMNAFALAWEQGADMIEGDFRRTADDRVVCHHDATLRRTGGSDVAVSELSLADLRTFDVGAWKDERFRGERVPTLDEVLDGIPSGKGLLIELKDDARVVDPLVRALEASRVDPARLVVMSFDADLVEAVRCRKPQVVAYWITVFERSDGDCWRPAADEVVATARRVGAAGVDFEANLDAIDGAMVDAMRRAGLSLHVWTVDDVGIARRFAGLGFDSITTNRPGELRAALRSAP
ncbi:MAG: glycerophosphodiester phosphodiesterase [Phycisphaeraceae bacterium]|nr:glycerophosphodiester phosphodiesterase [Phycisphaeraceae bacterium]